MLGSIFDIQRYSLHNGPGIRTTVFLKGCPLSCWWCHNPEGQEREKEVVFEKNGCIGCGDCMYVCPVKAISPFREGFFVNQEDCTLCGLCADICPTGSFKVVGQRISPGDLLQTIEKDTIFYDESGGGVTLSGGEPFYQVDFLEELLPLLKEKGFHVAVDTSGYTSYAVLYHLKQFIDLFLYDVKHMDPEVHKRHTGVSNRLILENLKNLTETGVHVVLRMPFIPGVNDDEGHLQLLAEFISSLNLKGIHLLPYHRMAVEKYRRLAKRAPFSTVVTPSLEKLKETLSYMKDHGIHCTVGG